MLVASLGDIMLDVIVDVPDGLVPDDDTDARITVTAGGQAANVARWVHAYAGEARLFGPRAAEGPGRHVDEALEALGIEVSGPVTSRSGVVVSVLSRDSRSLASDAGSSDWLEQVTPGPWLQGADWLFLSGYALLRAADPGRLVALAEAAAAAGTRVAVDLSSAAMIEDYGPRRFRRLWQSLHPAVVLANEREWAATHADRPGDAPVEPGSRPDTGFGTGGRTVLVLKQGARGCSFVIDGVVDHRPVRPGRVRDVTGAGDALTAGFLLGGPELAMEAAARCVAQVGGQPNERLEESS